MLPGDREMILLSSANAVSVTRTSNKDKQVLVIMFRFKMLVESKDITNYYRECDFINIIFVFSHQKKVLK